MADTKTLIHNSLGPQYEEPFQQLCEKMGWVDGCNHPAGHNVIYVCTKLKKKVKMCWDCCQLFADLTRLPREKSDALLTREALERIEKQMHDIKQLLSLLVGDNNKRIIINQD